MKRLFALPLAVLIFAGCNDTTSQQLSDPTSNVSILGVPMPSAEILAALGPENDIPIQRLLPNPLFVVVGKPKQFLASPISTGGEQLVEGFIRQGLCPVFDPHTVEQFVSSSGFPVPVTITIPHPQDPDAPPLQRIVPMTRRATIITFDNPLDKTVLLTTVLRGNADPTLHELLKRTEGKNEYYDITPRTEMSIPLHVAFGIIDARTVVLVEGTEDDVKSVFSDTVPKSAVLERVKHIPIGIDDLTVVASLEGMSFDMLGIMQEQFGQGNVPPGVLSNIKEHLRAISLSLNTSAAIGQPVVSILVEGRDETGAKAIEETIGGLILLGQTSVATMGDAPQMIPPDLTAALLKAMSIETKGTRVSIALNNYEALIPTIAKLISAAQSIEMDRLCLRKMVMIADFITAYLVMHKKYPTDIFDADGTPLLSWRVALLPIMGMDELYNNFKMDEPWDSAANKELLNEIPIIFQQSPLGIEPAKTSIRYFDSAGAPLSRRDLTADDVPYLEGLMLTNVAPQYAVEWTKPEPLEFNIDKIADIFGNRLLGVTFLRQTIYGPILPNTDPNYEQWKQDIQTLIYGPPTSESVGE